MILLALVLTAAPSIETWGYAPDALKPLAVEATLNGELPNFPVTAAVKALPVAQRAQAVKTLAGWVKTFVSSAEFKSLYTARLGDLRAPKPQPKRTADQIAKDRRAELDKQVADMLANVSKVPPDMQAQLKSAAADMKKNGETMLADKKTLELIENARFDEENARYQQSLAQLPDDPKDAIKRVLGKFLEATQGIDYGAKLVPAGDRKRFANPDYESKDWAWKMGFRAGKDATEAARAFCDAWLKELK